MIGVTQSARPPNSDGSSGSRLLDLSYDLAPDSMYWPSGRPFEITKSFKGISEHGIWVAVQDFCAPEHGGTHLDAPIHFARNGWTVDQIPVERLIGPAVVLDISEWALRDPDAQLGVEDLQEWERRHGTIPNGSIVLMHSGWGKYYGNESEYFGNGNKDTTKFHFPGMHPSAAKWLVANRAISGVGVDTPSLDYGPSSDFLTHQVLSEANIYGLENVANTHLMPASGDKLIILPIKIRGGTGAPCRILAHTNDAVNIHNLAAIQRTNIFTMAMSITCIYFLIAC